MATSNLTFADWQQKTNAGLMSAAEELLDKLEDTSDLLTEIDEKYIVAGERRDSDADDRKTSMIQRFHAGLDSARNLVNVLKREKWRLSKREMSVELRMGELEDYKLHLKSDMSSLNQTVDALSMRVVQLENQLVEAQETQENLEAELDEHRKSLLAANDRNMELYTENADLKKAVKDLQRGNVQKENGMLRDEVSLLQTENSKLKDMVRHAEAHAAEAHAEAHPAEAEETPHSTVAGSASSPSSVRRKATPVPLKLSPVRPPRNKEKDDNLSKLTKEFLDELTSLELRERKAAKAAVAASSSLSGEGVSRAAAVGSSASAATTTTATATSGSTDIQSVSTDSPSTVKAGAHTIHLKADDV